MDKLLPMCFLVKSVACELPQSESVAAYGELWCSAAHRTWPEVDGEQMSQNLGPSIQHAIAAI